VISGKIEGLEELLKDLNKVNDQLYDEVRDEGVDIINDVRNKAIKGMKNTPVDTTKGSAKRFTTNKTTGRRKSIKTGKAAKFHYPSLPGNYPAIDSGELVGSVMTSEHEFELEVGSIAPHALPLETRKRNPRMWLKPSFKGIPMEKRLVAAFVKGLDRMLDGGMRL